MYENVPGNLFGLRGYLEKYVNHTKKHPFHPQTTTSSKRFVCIPIDCNTYTKLKSIRIYKFRRRRNRNQI